MATADTDVPGMFVQQNAYAVVQKVGGTYSRVAKLVRKNMILIEKLKFVPDNAFGKPYGTVFDVRKGGALEEATTDGDTDAASDETWGSSVVVDGQNEDSVNGADVEHEQTSSCAAHKDDDSVDDANVADCDSGDEPSAIRQRLCENDVLRMKKDGSSGAQIVSRLVQGNIQFGDRSEYSQDKYRRRKTRKHGDRVMLLRPSIRLVAEAYYHKEPERIANLRVDVLSEMLTRGNVHFACRVLVVEQCQGLLTAAVLERVVPDGLCVHVHQHDQAQGIPCLHAMNFDEQTLSAFHPFPASFIVAPSMCDSIVDGSCVVARVIEHVETEPTENLRLPAAVMDERRRKRAERLRKHRIAESILNERRIDSLLVAVRTTPALATLQALLPAVRPSSPVVVYSTNLQPLVEIYDWLRVNERAVDIRLSDNFFRQYQVLPGRTHPEMVQNVTGGYVLSAVTLL